MRKRPTPDTEKQDEEGLFVQSSSRSKRRKISQACEQCRARKSRCDGVKPICGECAGRPNQNTPCCYSFNHAKGDGYDEYVSSLLARINELENRQHTIYAPSGIPVVATEDPQQNEQLFVNRIQSMKSPEQSQCQTHASLTSTSPVDAMGADNTIYNVSGEEQQSRFYGGSSATALTRQIYQALGGRDDLSHVGSPLASMSSRDLLHRDDTSWNTIPVEHFSLLPRQFTDTLLNVYWEKIHHLYPIIHKPTFMNAYERLWISHESSVEADSIAIPMLGSALYGHDSYIFHCALNSMLALATQLMNKPPTDRARLAEIFEVKSRNLCRLDLFDDGSLACIQTLLLMTMYLQSTPFPNKCWNCVGIACRLAQGLGLHNEPPKLLSKISFFELEMRRRVWHSCIILDTIVSTTLGRPMMLHKFTPAPLPSPSPIDDEYLPASKVQPQTQTSQMCFYIESIKLYNILADIIAKIYGRTNLHPASLEKEAGIEEISRLDATLSKFENDLPLHLKHNIQPLPCDSPRPNSTFRQQACVMQARFLHLRLLLYRPTFLRFWHQQFSKHASSEAIQSKQHTISKVALAMEQSIASACVESAVKLIDLIAYSTTSSATGAWWYNLLYMRMAGTIVVLTMCCDTITQSVEVQQLNTAYQMCLFVLEGLKHYSSTVSQGADQLQRMYRFLLDSKKLQVNGLQQQENNLQQLSGRSQTIASNIVQGHATNGDNENSENIFLSENSIFEELLGYDMEDWSMESFGLMPN